MTLTPITEQFETKIKFQF